MSSVMVHSCGSERLGRGLSMFGFMKKGRALVWTQRYLCGHKNSFEGHPASQFNKFLYV